MSTRLVVDKREGLTESREPEFSPAKGPVRVAALILSYLFHPVFVPVYLVLFMVYVHPYLFVGVAPFDKIRIVLMAALMYSFFPLVTVLLLKALKFIQAIHLKTQKDRVIPLVACGIWYFWICYVWWNSSKMDSSFIIPKEAVMLSLGIFLASWLGLMANIKMKVSLHAISMGLAVTFMLLLAFSGSLPFGVYIAVTLLIAGAVCSSRFLVSDHTAAEIYTGFFAGVLAQLAAYGVAGSMW